MRNQNPHRKEEVKNVTTSGVYSRQEKLDLSVPKRVAVAGCGGVGSWVALLLAMSGVQELNLLDPDTLEESNLNRLPLSRSELGQHKVEAIRNLILRLRPEAVVHAYVTPATPALVEALNVEVLVDTTDDLRAQKNLSRTKGVRYVRAGYDGCSHFTVTSRMDGVWDLAQESTRYRVFPSWVAPAVITAVLATLKVVLDPTLEFNGGIERS
jgi:hypothetical protein